MSEQVVPQSAATPETGAYVFRAHGWLISFDGEQWQAVSERRQKVVGANEVLNAVAISAAWRRTHGRS